MNSKKTWIALTAMILVIALLVGVYFATRPQTQQGSKQITITVVHSDGAEKVVTCRTDAATLDDVLLAEGLIPEGGIVDGMFFTVDGETASWEADQAYWAFYIGEEYASVGICEATVTDGATYKLVYEKSSW